MKMKKIKNLEIQDFNEGERPLLNIDIDTLNKGKTFSGTIEIHEHSLTEISNALLFLSEQIFEIGDDVLNKKSLH